MMVNFVFRRKSTKRRVYQPVDRRRGPDGKGRMKGGVGHGQSIPPIKMTQQVNIPPVIHLPQNYVYVSKAES